jgi:TatD DNase family protein
MVKEIPKDRILTETDAPFLSPFPEQKNEPAFIKETIKIIAKIWEIPEKETEEILWENFIKVFNYR